MPVKSRFTIHIPNVSLPTYLFTSPAGPLSNAPILIDAKRPATHYLSFSTYRSWSKRLAVGLRAAGLQPGDRVLMFSPNSIFYPVVFMGVVMAGGIFTGMSPGAGIREVVSQLGDSGARWVLAGRGSLGVALEAVEKVGREAGRERVFLFDDEVRGEEEGDIKHWSSLLAPEKEGNAFMWEELSTREQADGPAALNYSSGTTGVPKGVMISHRNFVANTTQWIHMANMDPKVEEKRKKSNWLGFLPMYHAMAQLLFVLAAPKRDIPVYISPKFDFIQMLEDIQKFKVDNLILVPPIFIALAKHPAVRSGKYDISSVTNIGCGAAPLGREVIEAVQSLWPPGVMQIQQGWGLTEATCAVLGTPPVGDTPTSSVGQLQANCEAKVMNEGGTAELTRGQRGEIWIKGPSIMKGYWRNPEATREVMTEDGWLKTGDIGFCDEGGNWWVVDRVKELIKVQGFQVAPAELEALLLEHPAVADAGVVGVTINGQEAPRAYVVLQPGAKKTTSEEIKSYVRENVMKHKWLTGGVVFVEFIPKNPSGKILRKILRERAREQVGDKQERASKL